MHEISHDVEHHRLIILLNFIYYMVVIAILCVFKKKIVAAVASNNEYVLSFQESDELKPRNYLEIKLADQDFGFLTQR